MKKAVILFWLILFPAVYGFSQTLSADEGPAPAVNPDLLEEAAERSAGESDADLSTLSEYLTDLKEDPVNINKAGAEELARIPGLSPASAKAILDHLATYGDLLSIHGLLAIPGFDSALIVRIAPYISVRPVERVPALTPANLARFGRHQLIVTLSRPFPVPEGYHSSDQAEAVPRQYPGSPDKLWFRYGWNWLDRIRIGLAGEKDPGEQIFGSAQQQGMDHYSGYVALSRTGIIRQLVIGNYRASFGQGLVLGSAIRGTFPGQLAGVPPAAGIRPSLSTDEIHYFRGVACAVQAGPVTVSGLFSDHPRDGSLAIPAGNATNKVSIGSLNATGYHRTATELSRRNAFRELVVAGNVTATVAKSLPFGMRAGLTVLYDRFSLPVARDPSDRYRFAGRDNLNASVDLQMRIGTWFLYGEMGWSRNGKTALLAGTRFSPAQGVGFSAEYRSYRPGYQALYALPPGQGDAQYGEEGLLVTLTASPLAVLDLAAYGDLFRFPSPRYRQHSAASGCETGCLATWKVTTRTVLQFRFRQKSSQTDGGSLSGISYKLTDFTARNYRLVLDWTPSGRISLATRLEFSTAGTPSGRTAGTLVYQQLRADAGNYGRWTVRFTLFDVPAYEARIWVCEPDVPMAFSVPAFQGRGVNAIAMVNLRITRWMDFWFRCGATCYTDRDRIGTGADQTSGRVRAELSGQLRVRL